MSNPTKVEPDHEETLFHDSAAPSRNSGDDPNWQEQTHTKQPPVLRVSSRTFSHPKDLPPIDPVLLRNTDNQRFVFTLFDFVNDSASNHVIWWHEDGRSFCFHQNPEFESHLKRRFRTERVGSFVRQLNNYGFRKRRPAKSTRGAAKNEVARYEHDLFTKKQSPADLRRITKRRTGGPAAGTGFPEPLLPSSHENPSVSNRIQRLGDTQSELMLRYRTVVRMITERVGSDLGLDLEEIIPKGSPPPDSPESGDEQSMEELLKSIEEQQEFQKKAMQNLCAMLHMDESETVETGAA